MTWQPRRFTAMTNSLPSSPEPSNIIFLIISSGLMVSLSWLFGVDGPYGESEGGCAGVEGHLVVVGGHAAAEIHVGDLAQA